MRVSSKDLLYISTLVHNIDQALIQKFVLLSRHPPSPTSLNNNNNPFPTPPLLPRRFHFQNYSPYDDPTLLRFRPGDTPLQHDSETLASTGQAIRISSSPFFLFLLAY